MTTLERLNRYRVAHNLSPLSRLPASGVYFVRMIVAEWEQEQGLKS